MRPGRSTSTPWASALCRRGKRDGEFFTPTSIVKLIVEIIEPFHGRNYDPACGLREALRAVKRVAKLNLSFTPEYMLK